MIKTPKNISINISKNKKTTFCTFGSKKKSYFFSTFFKFFRSPFSNFKILKSGFFIFRDIYHAIFRGFYHAIFRYIFIVFFIINLKYSLYFLIITVIIVYFS